MERYKLLGKIGKGAHGLVFKATDLKSGAVVAIKQISVNIVNTGLSKNIMREISTLCNIKSDYIVGLIDVFNMNNTVLIVMECLQYSLSEFLLNLDCPLSLSQVKCCSLMILKGVQAIHKNHIMHRDLKPSNVLIDDRGILKIVDFGLSCIYDGNLETTYTHQIGTRWYRAPELLYGSQNYTPAIDIWAVGCIIAELLNNQPLFPGETDIGQLAIILSTLGTPTRETWPQLHKLPDYNKIVFTPVNKPSWNERFIDTDPDGVDLIRMILIYDYTKRLTVDEILNHRFFFVEPLACSPLEILKNYKITNSLIGKSFEEAIDIGPTI